MEPTDIYLKIIDALKDHQSTLFMVGHDFWHCDASDKNDRTGVYMPYRYYQTNRTKHMSTCGTCLKLMELRKDIRKYEKLVGIPLTPLISNFTEKEEVKRVYVKDNRICNPNYDYAMSGRS